MHYKKFFATMLVIAILGSVTSLITPIFLQLWGAEQTGLSIQKMLLLVGIMLFSQALSVLFTVYRERFAKGYNKSNLSGMMQDILNMDYDSITGEGSTNLLEKAVISVSSIYTYMTGDNIQIWSSIFISSVALVLLANMSLAVSLLLLLMIPINYFGYRLLNKELAKRSQAMQTETGEGFQEIISRMQQIDYLKQSSDHVLLMETTEPVLEKIYGSMARVNEYAQSVSLVLSGLNDIVRNFALIYMVFLFTSENASPYALMLFTILLPLYFSSISTITRANLRRSEFGIAKEFQKSLKQKAEKDGHEELSEIDTIDLAVDELTLPGRMLPFKACGKLVKGDIARIQGDSGTGKSTFAKGLLKFRPVKGIQVNGTPVEEVRNASLREHIEYLSQNVPIIKGTLRDNLFFNKPYSLAMEKRLTEEPILESIWKDKTMDTEILEGGANLSGGEKQKIALARALVSHCDVLVLDEICSNIDQGSVNDIYQRIHKGREGRITFIISHDPLPEGLANICLNQTEITA